MPLTPPDCDLRDFQRMMIDISRLRQSSFDAVIDDSAWRAGVNLWFSAWHAIPAGSLENEDGALAKAAGLGRDVKTWRKVKKDALRGFVECEDGRLYHETVCEFALEAWIEKLVQRISSGAGNAKRWKSTFDATPIEAMLSDAADRLAAIAPDSKSLAKARRRESRTDAASIPPGRADDPTGTTTASHRDHETIPPGSLETGTGTGIIGVITPIPAQRAQDVFPKPDFATDQVWRDFLANRKRKKLANTATAHTKLLRDLDRLSSPEWPPSRLLEHAAAKGWGGIYDPNGDDQHGARQFTSQPSAGDLRGHRPDPALDLVRRARAAEGPPDYSPPDWRDGPALPSFGSGRP
ncbi:Protein of unknown function [Sphingomonas sp. NFR15]|nr:Protein of unknown function [Sphingomonas sp. NFR15]